MSYKAKEQDYVIVQWEYYYYATAIYKILPESFFLARIPSYQVRGVQEYNHLSYCRKYHRY